MTRILLVEDDLSVADTVQSMLCSGGYDVDWAKDGDQALLLFQEGGFDLVLCDVHMPGKDGFEVIAEIRRASPDVPIVSMTGSYPRDTGGDPGFLRNSGKVGATKVIMKPFRAHEILALVQECLTSRLGLPLAELLDVASDPERDQAAARSRRNGR